MAFKHRRLTAKSVEGADKIELSKSGRAIIVTHKAVKAEVDPKTKVVKGHLLAEMRSYYPVNDGNLKRMRLWKPKR